MNPTTEITMEEGSYLEMEMVQIKGVDSTIRKTKADLDKDAQADYPRETSDPRNPESREQLCGKLKRRRFQRQSGFPIGCKR